MELGFGGGSSEFSALDGRSTDGTIGIAREIYDAIPKLMTETPEFLNTLAHFWVASKYLNSALSCEVIVSTSRS